MRVHVRATVLVASKRSSRWYGRWLECEASSVPAFLSLDLDALIVRLGVTRSAVQLVTARVASPRGWGFVSPHEPDEYVESYAMPGALLHDSGCLLLQACPLREWFEIHQ